MKHFKSKNIKYKLITKSTKKNTKNNTRIKLLENCILNELEETKDSEEKSDILEKFVEY